MNKTIHSFLIIFLLISQISIAQFQSVQIGVNGLTCSQCTKSVEMSLRKLAFVKDVRMDLANTEGEITFKEGALVDIKKLAQAVVDAGFSVRYVSAILIFNQVNISENYCWIFENSQYQFIKTENKELNGLVKLNFIGKQFMPNDELKNWGTILEAAKGKSCEAPFVYFVTL